MTTKLAEQETRTATTSLEIAASPEAVWRALTDPQEIVNWFALSADVSPGVGGTVTWRWHDVWTWPSRIAIWEPQRRLRLAYVHDIATGEKAPAPAGAAERSGQELVIDFYLEAARGGGTVLRLVHAGFGRDASWDDEYQGVRRGWTTELAALKHYLERHNGERRRVLWAFVRTGLSAAEAWARLVGARPDSGHVVTESADGMTVAALPGGTPAAVVVTRREDAGDLIGVVPSWHDAQLRIWLDPVAEGTLAHVFITLYGDAANLSHAPTGALVVETLRRAFPDAAELVAMH